MQEAEKVDLLIARKSLTLQAIQQESIHPRIQTIYRSFENFHLQYCETNHGKAAYNKRDYQFQTPLWRNHRGHWCRGKFISDIPDEQQQIDETSA